MLLLSFALAGLLWERLETIPLQLRAIPFGILALSILFAVYAYGRRREVGELKELLHGLQEHVGAAPSEEQLDQLSQVIMRSQRNFKELIDSFDDPACAVSLDGTMRTVNRRISELTGLPYSELIGRKIYDLIEEPNQEVVERGLGRFLQKKRWAGTARIRLKNSSRPLYFECVLNGIAKGDEVVGASMLGRDVTEQREKEMRFTELFETLQEGVYFSTPEGQLLDANPALVSMLGYVEKDDLLAVESAALNFDAGPPVLGRALDDRGGVRTREIRIRRKDGTAAIFLDSSRAVWDTSGNIIRYQGTLVDITEKRKMERQLAQQEEFRARLLESFPDLILVVDLEERYTFVSSRARDLLGYAPQDMLGKKISELDDHSPELALMYHEIVSGRQVFASAEYGVRHRDGNWRTMRAAGSQLVDAESKISGVIISVRDITVERKLEQQVVQSERLAAMGAMIGGVAHELNNPLTSVMGFSELLRQVHVDPQYRRYLEMIHKSALRCQKIVQALLSFARRQAPERKPVCVNQLIEAALDILSYQLRTSNIESITRLDPNVPQAMVDPHQIQQVLVNLINNARQAIEANQPAGWIRITTERAGNRVRVILQDSGPGIPPENLSKIFDPFFTTKEVGVGTGLGLSLCYGIIKEHGGTIRPVCKPGEGATFIIELPVTHSRDTEVVAVAEPAPPPPDPKEGRGRKVLVIDDEEPILQMVRETLSACGYEVDLASDGETGLRRLREKAYDLTLCDCRMPGISGPQVYERLRKADPKLSEKFIFITGDVIGENTRCFLEKHKRICLPKPFTLSEFRSAVKKAVAAR